MTAFFCTADGAGALALVDWSARAEEVGAARSRAERLACPSHVVRNGSAPHGAGLPSSDVARLLADGATATLFGVLSHPSLDRVVQLLCPECEAPVHVATDAPAWVPPDVEVPEPPAPVPVFTGKSATLVPGQAAIPSDIFEPLGFLTTAVVGLVDDLARALGIIVGRVEAAGGAVELRLVEVDLANTERVLATGRYEAGVHRYIQTPTAVGAIARGPCEYRLEGRLAGATSGNVRGLSLALYEVPL